MKKKPVLCPICSGSVNSKPKPMVCVLYKDEGGVFTADPKIVPDARLIKEIGYEEMMEIGAQGAKVVHPGAVGVAMQYGVIIFVTKIGSSTGTFIH